MAKELGNKEAFTVFIKCLDIYLDIYFNKNEKVPVISSELLASMSKQFIKEYNEYKTSKSKGSFIDQFKFATNITVKTSDGVVMEIANDEIMEQDHGLIPTHNSQELKETNISIDSSSTQIPSQNEIQVNIEENKEQETTHEQEHKQEQEMSQEKENQKDPNQ